MATRAATTGGRDTRIAPAGTAARRGVAIAGGIALLGLAAALVAALVSYDAHDASFDTVTGRVPQNLLGAPGAWVADALLFAAGYAAAALVPVVAIGGVRLLRRKGFAAWRRSALATLAGTLCAAGAVGALWPDPDAALPAGSGGLTGLVAAGAGDALAALPALAAFPMASLLALVLAMVALPLLIWGSGIDRGDVVAIVGLFRHRAAADDAVPVERRRPLADAAAAIEQAAAPRATIVTPAAPAAVSAKRGRRDRQPTLGLGDIYELPPLDLLKPVPKGPVVKIDRASLEQNARLLGSVLDDFGVKGRIGDVRPGPVVTMYELEPAPGLKASRVIGLSDDIARSMSAVSARVAVVPGRNVIGIELPNPNRQMVTLSELLASAAFEDQSAALPLVLEAVIIVALWIFGRVFA